MIKKNDRFIAAVFALLMILFLGFVMANEVFFNWVFERHQNPMSWYIRPLFLIPFCYFAYRRCWSGISLTLFGLFTSMFWFNKPDAVSVDVLNFLQVEKEWLDGAWDYKKFILILTVPISLIALGLAFWKRSLWIGLGVMVLMATGKLIWSISTAGESGKSVLFPAVLGLLICSGLIYFGFRMLEKKDPKY